MFIYRVAPKMELFLVKVKKDLQFNKTLLYNVTRKDGLYVKKISNRGVST
jgi:hypothetical protein